MATYKTPGVYVEEISTLPPSVAEVATAVPAFIGCTAKRPTPDDDDKVVPIVARIDTLLDYETLFGEAPPNSFTASTQVNPNTNLKEVVSVERDKPLIFDYTLYYALSLYFKNGGGSCYVVSIGNYKTEPTKADFETGLAELEKEDEPTLILLTDAVNLDNYYALCQQALAQCNKLRDRFAIIDVKDGEVKSFRNTIGTNYLKYGAAYHPYLNTSLNYQYQEDQIKIDPMVKTWQKAFGDPNGIIVRYTSKVDNEPKVTIVKGEANLDVTFSISATNVLKIENVDKKTGESIVAAWKTWVGQKNNTQGFEIIKDGDGSDKVPHTAGSNKPLDAYTTTLATLKDNNTALYNQIKTWMTRQRVILPPSPAVAGVYASVDRERGVWKAPANVSLTAVIGPVSKITHDEQEKLNVDPTAGKSINAIRAFTGKGTLIWGARTLAGNDNEWRYISVRRLFNMIEESTQKATAFAVFEPNDATTWLKVKAMIESYLYGLWEQGALAGPTSEAAYFVNVGLGKTMTPQNVLEGRMIVEIGVAAVRPAEFIVLRFTHKMQEA